MVFSCTSLWLVAKIYQNLKYDLLLKVVSMKTAKLEDETHTNLMVYKAEGKFKNISRAIDNLLELKEWTA